MLNINKEEVEKTVRMACIKSVSDFNMVEDENHIKIEFNHDVDSANIYHFKFNFNTVGKDEEDFDMAFIGALYDQILVSYDDEIA